MIRVIRACFVSVDSYSVNEDYFYMEHFAIISGRTIEALACLPPALRAAYRR